MVQRLDCAGGETRTPFISFPTALLAEYIREEVHWTTAVAVYSGTLAVTAVFFTLLWLYAAGNYRLVDRNIDPPLLRAMTRRYVFGTLSYILALISVLPEPDGSRSARRTRRRSAGG